MLSPSFSPTPDPRATRRSPRRGAKSRTVATRKVYGKRKTNAPRAVLDHVSPPRVKAGDSKAVEAMLEDVQQKLANVRIEVSVDDHVSNAVEAKGTIATEDDAKTVDTQAEKSILQQCTPVKKGDRVKEVRQKIKDQIASTPLKHTPKAKPHYETLVEVRIPVKSDSDTPTDSQLANDTTTTLAELETKASKKKKLAPRLSSGCIQDEKTKIYVRSILDEAMSPVASQGVQKFSSWAARAGNAFDVVKIAEGSYGEVYKLRFREDICKQEMSKSKIAKLRAYGDGVFKIVPLRAKTGAGSKKFTSIDEIVSEVKLLKYLDPIPGFARFREIHVVQGRFPESFQAAWMEYKRTKDDCLNPNPANKRAYPDTQLWAILEMDDAGCELEKFSWSSIFQIYDIFWGVAMALARAEEYAMFEHRDLHLGNICLRTTRPDGCMEPPMSLTVKDLKNSSGFGLSFLETTIIDYSLSRAELRFSDNPNEQAEIASSDLDKKQIFDAIGRDEDEILLRNTYRYMRGHVYKGNPLDQEKPSDIPGIWSEYTPKTNLIWLLFILKNLLKHKKNEPEIQHQRPPPREPLGPCSGNINKTIKTLTTTKSKFEKPKTQIITTGSENQKQHNNNNKKSNKDLSKKIQETLSSRLDQVLNLLDLEHGHEDMCCAADLVAYAIDSQWLDEKDFFT